VLLCFLLVLRRYSRWWCGCTLEAPQQLYASHGMHRKLHKISRLAEKNLFFLYRVVPRRRRRAATYSPAILASFSLVQHSNFQPMYSNSSRHGHEVDRHTMAVFINCDHHQTRGTKCECSAHASILHSWAMIQYDETTCTGTKQNGLQPTSHDPHTNCHAQPHACSPATNDSTKAYKCH
jgi:hypothetical protein